MDGIVVRAVAITGIGCHVVAQYPSPSLSLSPASVSQRLVTDPWLHLGLTACRLLAMDGRSVFSRRKDVDS